MMVQHELGCRWRGSREIFDFVRPHQSEERLHHARRSRVFEAVRAMVRRRAISSCTPVQQDRAQPFTRGVRKLWGCARANPESTQATPRGLMSEGNDNP